MEEDGEMRRLLEQFEPNFYPGLVTSDIFVPSGCVTNIYFKNLKELLIVKKYLIYEKWEMFFAISCLKALSSHEMYLSYVFFACEFAIGFSDDVFDALLTVFVLVPTYNIETGINSGADFCGLSIDIILVFYENTLKEEFYSLGGFERFAEYLRHEYLEWERYFDDLAVEGVGSFEKKAHYKLKEELGKLTYRPEFITYDNVMKNSKCQSFAKQILTSTKLTLPKLPSPSYLKARLRCTRKCKADIERERNASASTHKISEADSPLEKTGSSGKPEGMESSLQECSNLKINNITGNRADVSQYNNIVQAVIRYNNSKISDGANNGIQNEINEILKRLKDRIKSLIEILDKGEF